MQCKTKHVVIFVGSFLVAHPIPPRPSFASSQVGPTDNVCFGGHFLSRAMQDLEATPF